MSAIGPFLLLLGPLVVIHELGHLLVAKFFGVLCERFTIGFGPPLFRYKVGETEYVIALLPLGGYVKMLGGESGDEELSEAERCRSFSGQSPLRRTLIALAGPAMNVLLAIVVVAGVSMTTGWPDFAARIGAVQPDTPAERAGLQGGDRVVAIDGHEIASWDQLVERVAGSPGRALELRVDRSGQEVRTSVTPEPGAETGRGTIGIEFGTPVPILAFPEAASAGARAGLQTGDRVVGVSGAPVGDVYALRRELAKASGHLAIEVERTAGGKPLRVSTTVEDTAEGAWSLERLGAVELDFAVQDVAVSSPARRGGLEPGDVFLSVNGQGVRSRNDLIAQIQAGRGAPLQLKMLRAGEIVPLEIVPATKQTPGQEPRWELGVLLAAPRIYEPEIYLRMGNPIVAFADATTRTWGFVVETVGMLGKLVTREVGLDAVAGPIGIGELAFAAFEQPGWYTFLRIMALISVNLAVINLLPVPVLDGGHIVFAAAEAISGGPLGQRAREVAQTLGLSFILMLMGFAFWNDIARNWQSITGFFKDHL